jgi:hypothetical protein
VQARGVGSGFLAVVAGRDSSARLQLKQAHPFISRDGIIWGNLNVNTGFQPAQYKCLTGRLQNPAEIECSEHFSSKNSANRFQPEGVKPKYQYNGATRPLSAFWANHMLLCPTTCKSPAKPRFRPASDNLINLLNCKQEIRHPRVFLNAKKK